MKENIQYLLSPSSGPTHGFESAVRTAVTEMGPNFHSHRYHQEWTLGFSSPTPPSFKSCIKGRHRHGTGCSVDARVCLPFKHCGSIRQTQSTTAPRAVGRYLSAFSLLSPSLQCVRPSNPSCRVSLTYVLQLIRHEVVIILVGFTWGLGWGLLITAVGTFIGEVMTFLYAGCCYHRLICKLTLAHYLQVSLPSKGREDGAHGHKIWYSRLGDP
jgi:hypothetical protein